MRDMWRIYRTEGIEKLDFRPGFKDLRGAYFNDDCGVSVMLAAGFPDEPTIFTMARELKHHLVDSDIRAVLCISKERQRIEIVCRGVCCGVHLSGKGFCLRPF